ncbi:MAG: hypothetical protein RBG1_1C00001G1380 [candidate division Zixibacteria bacterium RBG-1]|nr:MAG: hypothetical protein RBG1_1C00001G1380 [candidate division Zixibacteria bacterium RBG-1]OGC85538.1 MAG: hypothetical protein A2V73_06250 [candidate division Zixibacteria bacterium RBG_19FT_COMBO_42_43]
MIEGHKVCVVIPEWNEFDKAIYCAQKILQEVPTVDKIIIVDDGSEGFQNKPVDHKIDLLANQTNQGTGFTFITGINHALKSGYDFVICWTLLDRGFFPVDFKNVVEGLTKSEVVYGVRVKTGQNKESFSRCLGRRLHIVLFKIHANFWLKDSTIGMRGFRKSAFEKIGLPSEQFLRINSENKNWSWFFRYGFETWILLQAFKSGCSVNSCTVHDLGATNSSIKLFGKNSFRSIYTPFFRKVSFSQPDGVAKK